MTTPMHRKISQIVIYVKEDFKLIIKSSLSYFIHFELLQYFDIFFSLVKKEIPKIHIY